MRNPEDPAAPKDRKLQGVAFLILGVMTFLLYSRTYDYVVVSQRDTASSFFLFDREFLLGFLWLPGGLLTWAGRFFAQFSEYTWLGALAISVLVVAFGFLLYRALRRFMGAAALFFALLPCILLATELSDGVINTALGLIAGTLAFLIYLHLPKGAVRRLYALLATPALYLLSGGYFWLFAGWVIAAEWLEGRRFANWTWSFLFAALAFATPVAARRWLFVVPLRSAFLQPTVFFQPGRPPTPAMVVYGYLALLMPAVLLCKRWVLPFWERAFARARPAPAAGRRLRFVAAGAAAALLAVLTVDLQWVCYDANLSDYAEYRELYRQKRWDDILQRAETTASPGLMKQFFINCALYHKGRLLDELFRYRQAWGARGLILNSPDQHYIGTSTNDLDREMFNSDLFFEMGNANAALMCAYDQMVVQGETYDNVRRVAECNMVRGNYAWAMKFLTMLKRTLFHRGEALRYEALLADPKARDEYFAERRSRLPTVELPLELPGFIPALGLLKSNPHNRMACDYLMAWCLLDRASLPMLAESVGGLRAAGYDHIPLALQEGLLALQAMSGRPLAPPGFRFDREVAARFIAFNAQMQRSPDDPAAQRRAVQDFAGTFMYYSKFVAPQPTFSYALGHFAVANEFRGLGWTADAIAHYEYALRFNPGYAEAHDALAELLKSQGRDKEAGPRQREMPIQVKSLAPQPQTGADSAAWDPEDVP